MIICFCSSATSIHYYHSLLSIITTISSLFHDYGSDSCCCTHVHWADMRQWIFNGEYDYNPDVFAGSFLVFFLIVLVTIFFTFESFMFQYIYLQLIWIRRNNKCLGKSGVCRGNHVCSASSIHHCYWSSIQYQAASISVF